jgi:hypothetical protein
MQIELMHVLPGKHWESAVHGTLSENDAKQKPELQR